MWQAFLRSAVLTVISTSEGKFNWKQAVTKKPPENKSLVMTINVTFMYSFFFLTVSLEWIRQGQATGGPSKLVDG